MNRKLFGIILLIILLMGGSFYVGTKTHPNKIVLTSPFEYFSDKDSLGVFRLVGTDYYKSKDNKLKVEISYIQMGENDSFYQMKINGRADYYGSIYYDDKGVESGTFTGPNSPNPIKFHWGWDGSYIIINGVKTKLEAYKCS